MWFSILAIQAWAILRTLYPRSKALTIFFMTSRFLASTSSVRNQCWNLLKNSRVFKVYFLLRIMNLIQTILGITAVGAFAFIIADSLFGKTFAIHLETADFWTLTSLMFLLLWIYVYVIICSNAAFFLEKTTILIYQLVKEIFATADTLLINLYFLIGDELERPNKRWRIPRHRFNILATHNK